MKITAVMVASIDGRITEGQTSGTQAWVSREDQKIFQALITKHKVIIMGSKTYPAAQEFIKPDTDKRRIILTRTPEKYHQSDYRAGVELCSDSPTVIVRKLTKEGYDNLLLVGGGQTNARFFDAALVNELYLTIEPLLFGFGTPLIAPLSKKVSLQLLKQKQLNARGTILLHYVVRTGWV